MARNMKETNKKVFDKLVQLVEQAGVAHHVADLNAARWIKTDEEEKDFLKNAKHESSTECLPGKWASLLSHKSQLFVALPEAQQANCALQGVKAHTPNSGLLTLLWSFDIYRPINSSDAGVRIAENLFGITGGYDAAVIAPYFKPIQVFEVDKNIRSDDPEILIYKIYGAFLLDRHIEIPLPYSGPTRARITELLEGECGNIAADILFRAITASHWTHAFLDFYRCIERLYQVPYVEELRKGLGAKSHMGLGEQIAKCLDWRPKEDQALKRLLKDISNPAVITRLQSNFCKTPPSASSEVTDLIGGAIYKIRNSIAHFRSNRVVDQALSVSDWDQAIENLCELISELYKLYGGTIRL